MAAVVSKGCVHTVDLATARLEKVTEGPDDSWPSLSPDGKRLAFIRSGRELVVKDLTSGQSGVLYSLGESEIPDNDAST